MTDRHINLKDDVKRMYRNAYGDMVLMTSNENLVDEIWCRHTEGWSLFAGYSTEYGCDYLVVPRRLWDECGQTVEGLLA